jgi:hypothetical protein
LASFTFGLASTFVGFSFDDDDQNVEDLGFSSTFSLEAAQPVLEAPLGEVFCFSSGLSLEAAQKVLEAFGLSSDLSVEAAQNTFEGFSFFGLFGSFTLFGSFGLADQNTLSGFFSGLSLETAQPVGCEEAFSVLLSLADQKVLEVFGFSLTSFFGSLLEEDQNVLAVDAAFSGSFEELFDDQNTLFSLGSGLGSVGGLLEAAQKVLDDAL